MKARRQIDLFGSISACDASGRAVQIHCEGAHITLNSDSIRAAISALLTLRASGTVERLDPRVMEKLDDFRIDLCVRGNRIGRAGAGIRASRLARAVTTIPVELNFLALLKASLTSF